jgi:hypothetical protein
MLSFVHKRNHGDKEKKTIVKMLFSKDTKTLSNEKNILQSSIRKKSCAKVLNYLQAQA